MDDKMKTLMARRGILQVGLSDYPDDVDRKDRLKKVEREIALEEGSLDSKLRDAAGEVYHAIDHCRDMEDSIIEGRENAATRHREAVVESLEEAAKYIQNVLYLLK